jgi:hypothetical protein
MRNTRKTARSVNEIRKESTKINNVTTAVVRRTDYEN